MRRLSQCHGQTCKDFQTGSIVTLPTVGIREPKLRINRSPIIKRSLEPLHKDLSDIKEMLHECTRKPSVHVVDKVRYLVLYKAKFHSFQEKLPVHRESICLIQGMIKDQSPSERRASILKLDELAEIQKRPSEKGDEHDRAQQEAERIFQEHFTGPQNARKLSAHEMLEQFKDHMVIDGTLPGKADAHVSSKPQGARTPSHSCTAPNVSGDASLVFRLDVFETGSHSTTTARPGAGSSVDEV